MHILEIWWNMLSDVLNTCRTAHLWLKNDTKWVVERLTKSFPSVPCETLQQKLSHAIRSCHYSCCLLLNDTTTLIFTDLLEAFMPGHWWSHGCHTRVSPRPLDPRNLCKRSLAFPIFPQGSWPLVPRSTWNLKWEVKGTKPIYCQMNPNELKLCTYIMYKNERSTVSCYFPPFFCEI